MFLKILPSLNPAPSPVFHEVFLGCVFPGLGECSEGWDRGEGLWFMGGLAKATPSSVLSQGRTQACILDLKGRPAVGFWTTRDAVCPQQSGKERPEHFSGSTALGGPVWLLRSCPGSLGTCSTHSTPTPASGSCLPCLPDLWEWRVT